MRRQNQPFLKCFLPLGGLLVSATIALSSTDAKADAYAYTTRIIDNGSPLKILSCSVYRARYAEVTVYDQKHVYEFPIPMSVGTPDRTFDGMHHDVDLINNDPRTVVAFEMHFDIQDLFGRPMTSSTWEYTYRVEPGSTITHRTIGLTYTEIEDDASSVSCSVTAVRFDDGTSWLPGATLPPQTPIATPMPVATLSFLMFTDLTPPSGWKAAAVPREGVKKWLSPDHGQAIIVGSSFYFGGFDEFEHNIANDARAAFGDVAHGDLERVEICQGRPADIVIWRGKKDKKAYIIETEWTVENPRAYFAYYSRASNTPASRAAISALRTLCPASS
jgi:hypothetical protein